MPDAGHTTSAEPIYLTRLALQVLPFRHDAEPDFFYTGETIEPRLNLLLHLLRVSDTVVFLQSKPGIGKTSLLQQVQRLSGNELRIVYIALKSVDSVAQLLAECGHGYGAELPDNASSEQWQQQLKARLQRLRALSIRPVLLVDDVDKIAPDSELFALIMELLSWKDGEHFVLQGVLTSSTAISLPDRVQARIQRMDLLPLSRDELPAYLMHRLRVAGYQGTLPFSDRQLAQIYKNSAGSPARINQYAHQLLLRQPLKRHLLPHLLSISSQLRKWGVASVGVGILVLLLFFQDDINVFVSQSDSRPYDELQVIELPEETAVKITASQQVQPVQNKAMTGREELVQLVTELERQPHLASQHPTETVQNTALDKQQDVTAHTLYHEQWIMQRNPHHFTFQLMGAWQQSEVYAFVRKYALSGPVAIYTRWRDGQPWYVLIYGDYPDKTQAKQARKKWPAPRSTLPVWLRRLDSIQQQIRNKAAAPQS